MTNAELSFYTLGSSFFRKNSNTEIDWEQRRYEIAKDFASARYCKDYGRFTEEDVITFAVKYADMLIAELKKG